MNALTYFNKGPQTRTVLADFTPADTVTDHNDALMRDRANAIGYGLRRTPPVTTSTVPPERRLFVWFRHKRAAEAMLADMLGDVPRLIAVHECDQLRGLDSRATFIEVLAHDYVLPSAISAEIKISGLVYMMLHDKWARAAYSAKIEKICRAYETPAYSPNHWYTRIAPDDLR